MAEQSSANQEIDSALLKTAEERISGIRKNRGQTILELLAPQEPRELGTLIKAALKDNSDVESFLGKARACILKFIRVEKEDYPDDITYSRAVVAKQEEYIEDATEMAVALRPLFEQQANISQEGMDEPGKLPAENAENWEELFKMFGSQIPVKGASSPLAQKSIINGFREGKLPLNSLTEDYGVREAVRRLKTKELLQEMKRDVIDVNLNFPSLQSAILEKLPQILELITKPSEISLTRNLMRQYEEKAKGKLGPLDKSTAVNRLKTRLQTMWEQSHR